MFGTWRDNCDFTKSGNLPTDLYGVFHCFKAIAILDTYFSENRFMFVEIFLVLLATKWTLLGPIWDYGLFFVSLWQGWGGDFETPCDTVFYYHITKGCLSVTHKPTSSGTAPLPHIRINRKMRAWHMNVLCYGMKSHKLSIMWRPIKKATGDMLITTPFMKWDLFIRCYTMSLVQWD